jgi:monoamine oxidase
MLKQNLSRQKVTRRKFLQAAGTAALGVPLLFKDSFAIQRRNYSAIIIGAGLSGLAAAYTLKQAHWDVTVLEARPRIGGRVLSYSFKDSDLICELGGEWVGESHERMKAYCSDFGIKLKDHRFQTSLMRNGVVSRPNQWNFSPQAITAFEKFKKDFEQHKQGDQKRRALYERRLDNYDWWTWLEEIGFTEDDLLLRDLQDSTDFGESIRHVSAFAAASEYFESSPANEMDYKMVGGNSRLVDEFVTRIGKNSIHEGALVEEIQQRAGRVIVKTKNGTFSADACICTVPSRVLDKIRFDPPLPAAHAQAAEQLQYSRIIKNSVLFDRRFWGDEDFSMVSDVTSHYYFHSTKDQPGRQGILCSYAIGEKADVLAAQDSARRSEIITRDLIPFNRNAPQLARDIQSYAWQRDQFTGGGYAIYRPGQWFTIRPILQRPHGKVLFAGEHLADWQGFMEGAVVTGEEAAKTLAGRTGRRRAA